MARKTRSANRREALAVLVVAMLLASPAAHAQQPAPPAPRGSEPIDLEQWEKRNRRLIEHRMDETLRQASDDISEANAMTCIADQSAVDKLRAQLEDDNRAVTRLREWRSELSKSGQKVFDDAAHRVSIRLYFALKHLGSLKPCPKPAPAPTAPAPQPPVAFPPPGRQAPTPPSLTPTHRTTRCPHCQGLAAALNRSADEYAAAVRTKSSVAGPLREEMAKLSQALDKCERVCIGTLKRPPSAPPGVFLGPR